MFRDLDVSENNGTPKSSILKGFSIIFTIHFGGFRPIFGNTQIGPVEFVTTTIFDIRLRVPMSHPKKNRKIRIIPFLGRTSTVPGFLGLITCCI